MRRSQRWEERVMFLVRPGVDGTAASLGAPRQLVDSVNL